MSTHHKQDNRNEPQSAPNNASVAVRPRLFDRLQSSLQEGAAHVHGEAALNVSEIAIPDPPPAYDSRRILTIRRSLKMSQPRFSRLLNVSPKTIQGWEQGIRVPGQSSARLLQLIENPDLLAKIMRDEAPQLEQKH